MSLYIVAVPIGNLGDITLRAIETLNKVDFIIAEDTRYSLKLLNHLKIKKKLISYYKHNEVKRSELILKMLKKSDGAIITDSGTPLISDPGFVLIKKSIESGIELISIPGPSALITALTISGIDPDKFIFLGFSPRTDSKLRSFLSKVKSFEFTLVFYESPRRVEKFLKIAKVIFGGREFAIVKELTKKNEKVIRGNLNEYSEIIADEIILGEIVIIIEGSVSKLVEGVPEINTMEDIYAYFKTKYSISKNDLKKRLMRKNNN